MKKIICLILCFALVFGLLTGCRKKDKDTDSDLVSSDNSEFNEDETLEDEEWEDEEFEDEDYEDWDEEDFEDEDFEDEDFEDEDFEDEEWEDEEYEDDWMESEPPLEATLEIYNTQAPIINNYMGFSGGIYHAYGFMKDDSTGRVYTDKMMDVELDRLQDTGVKVVRTRYQSQWMWKESTGYDWNSDRFNYFCDYAKEMQNRGIDVMIQVGWHFCKMSGFGIASINDVDYLYGSGEDRYGESSGYNFSGLSENDARIIKGANRYGYWIGETLKQLRARGINNANYLAYWVEPCNGYTERLNDSIDIEVDRNNHMPMGHDSREYVLFCRQMRNKLKAMNLDHTVDHMGPNEANAMDTVSPALKYVLENDPELFTILSAHHYPQSTAATNDTYYMYSNYQQEMYMRYLKDAGVYGKVQFWMDEFNCKDEGAEHLASGNSWLGLQNAVCAMAAQQNGIQNIMLWMPFDQLWTDRTSSSGEFKEGIHMCGLAPSLFVSATPYEKYYTSGLFTKYNSCKNGTVYKTNNKYLAEEEYASVYVSAMQNDDGKWVISVVNLNADDVRIHVKFDKAINATLYRYICESGKLKADFNATLPDADKTYGNVGDKFTDSLPGGSIAIYTEIAG